MGAFAKDFFLQSPALLYPVVALVIFFFVFVTVAVRALRAPRREMDALASLPLDATGGRHE